MVAAAVTAADGFGGGGGVDDTVTSFILSSGKSIANGSIGFDRCFEYI